MSSVSQPMNVVRFPNSSVPPDGEPRTTSQGTWGGGPVAQRMRSMPYSGGAGYIAASPGVMDVTNERQNFLRSLAVQRAVGFQQANMNPKAYISPQQHDLNNLQSDLALEPFMGPNYLQQRQANDTVNEEGTIRNQLLRESIPGQIGGLTAANAKTNAEAQNVTQGGELAKSQLAGVQKERDALLKERDALQKQLQTRTAQGQSAALRAKAQAYQAKVTAAARTGASPEDIAKIPFDLDEATTPSTTQPAPGTASPTTQPSEMHAQLPTGFVPHTPGTTYPDGTLAYMPDGSTKVYQGGNLVPYLTK